MASAANAPVGPAALKRRGRFGVGDGIFYVLTLLAGLTAVVLLVLITIEVLSGAWPAIQEFGLSFFTTETWNPVTSQFGAAAFIFGTALTSLFALLIAGPVAIAIALFLTELAPPLAARARRCARRDARVGAERRPRTLGHPRDGALDRVHARAVPEQDPRLDTVLRRRANRPVEPARRPS